MEGRLIGVGVGPGDPELLTLAAVRAIRESDCILLPNEKKEECYAYKIVRQVVPEIEEKEICPMQFPMTKDADVLRAAQDRCFAEVQARMRQGKTLVFLTIGDPLDLSLYSPASACGGDACVDDQRRAFFLCGGGKTWNLPCGSGRGDPYYSGQLRGGRYRGL